MYKKAPLGEVLFFSEDIFTFQTYLNKMWFAAVRRGLFSRATCMYIECPEKLLTDRWELPKCCQDRDSERPRYAFIYLFEIWIGNELGSLFYNDTNNVIHMWHVTYSASYKIRPCIFDQCDIKSAPIAKKKTVGLIKSKYQKLNTNKLIHVRIIILFFLFQIFKKRLLIHIVKYLIFK